MADEADWRVALETLKKDLNLSDDAIGLLALRLKFRLDDIPNVAAEAITGGGDDKKCDLIFLDKELQIAVVAQCYVSKKLRPAAPSNKASDLNTAISWLLSRELDDLPEALKGRADELRSAIGAGEIKQLYVWYVHNLPSSKNVSDELATVEQTIKACLRPYGNSQDRNIFTEEIGDSEIEKLYRQAERTIIVTDYFATVVKDAIEIQSSEWSSVVTAVSASWLVSLYKRYETDLFSANLRGYLGSRVSDSNINNGIKVSASDDPQNFFVYNNGLTAVVFDYELGKRSRRGRILKIKGISIVNGAQTTGSLGSLDGTPDPKIFVPIRFVKSEKEAIINNIVRFNNSQNKIQAADFRSTDPIQDRLRSEFIKIPDAEYEGGRRGGASDTIKRSKYTLPSYTVGQALAAFHGDPVTAYDKKSEIWTSEKLYRQIFTERTTARHIVFCYSLLDEINSKKLELSHKSRSKEGSLTREDKSNLDFLNRKGAAYLLVYIIAMSMETIFGKAIPNKTDLVFSAEISPRSASKKWVPIVNLFLSLSSQLEGGFSRGRISNENVLKVTPVFTGLIASLKSIHASTFHAFSKDVKLLDH